MRGRDRRGDNGSPQARGSALVAIIQEGFTRSAQEALAEAFLSQELLRPIGTHHNGSMLLIVAVLIEKLWHDVRLAKLSFFPAERAHHNVLLVLVRPSAEPPATVRGSSIDTALGPLIKPTTRTAPTAERKADTEASNAKAKARMG